MDRISAAGNLTIEMKPESWRLIANANGQQEHVLLEAAPNQPLRYIPMFAVKRRLPDTGALAVENVQRVVLGWSNDDESWHLGLLLEGDFATVRGSRWCEIARWPDPDTNVFNEVASQAGRSLARTLTRPFNLIQPQAKEAEAPTLPPLRDLPLQFDLWTLEKPDFLQFTRSPRWVRSRLIRIAWYVLLIAVYVGLSLLSLTGKIALPRPEFLPYLGLVTAALLLGLIIHMIFQLLTRPDRIVIDESSRSVFAMRGKSERWRVDSVAIESVYVSQIVGRRGKKHIIHHGEINLHMHDGSFYRLIDQSQPIDDLLPADAAAGEEIEAVVPLTTLSAYSDVQMAALWVAEALSVTCWYDRRVK